jgi:hypothetical protein
LQPVRPKRVTGGQAGGGSTPAQALLGKEPAEGSPAREPEPTVLFRLGVGIGELVERYQEGHWVGKCPCGSPRDTVAGQPRKVVVRSFVCLTVLDCPWLPPGDKG